VQFKSKIKVQERDEWKPKKIIKIEWNQNPKILKQSYFLSYVNLENAQFEIVFIIPYLDFLTTVNVRQIKDVTS